MNTQHKQHTVNNALNAVGDIGTSSLNRIRPLLELVYEAAYNQATIEVLSTTGPKSNCPNLYCTNQ